MLSNADVPITVYFRYKSPAITKDTSSQKKRRYETRNLIRKKNLMEDLFVFALRIANASLDRYRWREKRNNLSSCCLSYPQQTVVFASRRNTLSAQSVLSLFTFAAPCLCITNQYTTVSCCLLTLAELSFILLCYLFNLVLAMLHCYDSFHDILNCYLRTTDSSDIINAN